MIPAFPGSSPGTPAKLSNCSEKSEIMSISNIMIFSGNANPNLALKTVEFLNMPLGKITAGKFSDGEVMVEVNENVRGRDIYIMQPICAPTNDNLME